MLVVPMSSKMSATCVCNACVCNACIFDKYQNPAGALAAWGYRSRSDDFRQCIWLLCTTSCVQYCRSALPTEGVSCESDSVWSDSGSSMRLERAPHTAGGPEQTAGREMKGGAARGGYFG